MTNLTEDEVAGVADLEEKMADTNENQSSKDEPVSKSEDILDDVKPAECGESEQGVGIETVTEKEDVAKEDSDNVAKEDSANVVKDDVNDNTPSTEVENEVSAKKESNEELTEAPSEATATETTEQTAIGKC